MIDQDYLMRDFKWKVVAIIHNSSSNEEARFYLMVLLKKFENRRKVESYIR